MKRIFFSLALVLAAISFVAPKSAANDPVTSMLKQGGYTVSLDLKFSRKDQNSLGRFIALLDFGPNGFATGFQVGDGLVMTAYHVVSGNLSPAKKVQLGFGVKDQLKVKAYINGCEATVLKVDEDADLALLRVCQSGKQTRAPAFQINLDKDERLLLIARPHGDKKVKRGIFQGTYPSRGLQYLSATMEVRDGFSGSPVYNDRAEIIGVFSGYDWSKKLALISPGERAQKLLDDYRSSVQP